MKHPRSCPSTWLRLLPLVLPLFASAEPPADAPREWLQAALNSWESVCRDRLHLPLEPLPWVIFYDAHNEWQVAADPSWLPVHNSAGFTLHYNGHEIPVEHTAHDELNRIHVPDRAPVSADEPRIFTAPYDDGKKSVVLCAVPALSGRGVPDMSPPEFARFLLGILGHEMAHTRQVTAVDARLKQLGARHRLPASFDDNIVEKSFAEVPAYTTIFKQEMDRFAHAAFPDNATDDPRINLQAALALANQRREQFMIGDHATLAEIEEIYLMMEGIGQWVHFQVFLRSAPPGESQQHTAERFLQYTGTSWVQAEGFFMFIIIDREAPGWQQRFFANDFPSVFAVLEAVARSGKH